MSKFDKSKNSKKKSTKEDIKVKKHKALNVLVNKHFARSQILISTFLLIPILFHMPKVIFFIGPTVALILSLARNSGESMHPNGQYFVFGFGVSFCIAPFTYFIPYLKVLDPDANFYLFSFILNFVFMNVIILQLKNLTLNRIKIHKANLIGLTISTFVSLNFYKELLDPSKKQYLLNYFIRAGWDNVAHFDFFNQIFFNGTDIKLASTSTTELAGIGYPQHLHISAAWCARVLQPYSDSTEALYLFALGNFILFAVISVSIFFAISSISGDRLTAFVPAAALSVGVLFYSSASSAYLAGWHTFLFSQLLAFLAILVFYRIRIADWLKNSKYLYVGSFLCLLTNIWYLVGFVLVIIYILMELDSHRSIKRIAVATIASLPALITPFYFLYPSVGLSAIVTGNSPGLSWRIFLLALAIVVFFAMTSQLLVDIGYKHFAFITVIATGSCVFVLYLMVLFEPTSTTYYLNKLIQGCIVILVASLTIIVIEEVNRVNSKVMGETGSKNALMIYSAVLSFALLQSQVYLGPNFGGSTDYLPINSNNSNIRLLLGPSQEAIRLLNVSLFVEKHNTKAIYLSTFTTDPPARLADQWVKVLARKRTIQSEEPLLNSVSQLDAVSIIDAAKKYLDKYPKGTVIMSIQFYSYHQNEFASLDKNKFYLIDDFGIEAKIN